MASAHSELLFVRKVLENNEGSFAALEKITGERHAVGPIEIFIDDRYGSADKDLIQKSFVEAVIILDRHDPARMILGSYVRKVSFGLSADPAQVSFTNPESPGHIRFINYAVDKFLTIKIIEDLYHESIHCLLIKIEKTVGYLSPINAGYVVSPWSGNFIKRHSLLHAIFVYHGCNLMFRDLELNGVLGPNTELSRNRRRVIAAGFAAGLDFSKEVCAETEKQVLNSKVLRNIQIAYKRKLREQENCFL